MTHKKYFLYNYKKIYNTTMNEDLNIENENNLEDNDDIILVDDSDDSEDLVIITDINMLPKSNKIKKKNKRTKVIGKHTLAYDSIHNSKHIESVNDEEYYINDINMSFDIDPGIETDHNYNSDDYYFSIELKNKIFDLLVKHSDIDFSPDKKRRIPSVNDVNAYYQLLINELQDNKYSYTEIFSYFSELFTDNIWNVYKKLNAEYKNIICNELKDKYDIKTIENIDFL